MIRLELGYALLALINSEAGQKLTDQIKGLRRQLAGDMGFIMPAVRIQDNSQLAPNTLIFCALKKSKLVAGNCAPACCSSGSKGRADFLPGEGRRATFDLPPCGLIPHTVRKLSSKGIPWSTPLQLLRDHLTELLKTTCPSCYPMLETQTPRRIEQRPAKTRHRCYSKPNRTQWPSTRAAKLAG